MKKRLLSAVLAAALVFTLVACASEPERVEDEFSTLPSFPQELTPMEQLQNAIAATKNSGNRTIRYGTIRESGSKTEEVTYSQSVSDTQPFDRDALYEAVEVFPSNENFLQDFCNRRIQAVPSNTGVIRYQLTNLSYSDAQQLLFARTLFQQTDDSLWSVSIDLLDGRFNRLEVTVETEAETLTGFLFVTPSDSL
jgi:hypothetical protein